MRKILIMNDLIHSGGVEKILEELVNFLPQDKYKISVMSIYDQSDDFKKHYPSYAKYISLHKKFPPNTYKRTSVKHYILAVYNRICKPLFVKYMKLKKYDIVIAIKEGLCMKFLADFKAKNKIAWVHVDYNYLYWTKNVFPLAEDELECMKKYDNVVCVSHAALNSVKDTVGNPGNLIVRYNPMNVDEIIEKSKQVPEDFIELKKNYAGTVLVAVGGLRKQKNYISLLKCCNKLKSDFEFKLLIIGEGSERSVLEEYIESNELGEKVILLGNRDNPYPYVANADWFVSSTDWESYGLAIQEALILKTPVLTTTCPAIMECVSEKEAVLVDNDEKSLYEGLYKILSDKYLREKYILNINRRTQKNMYNYKFEEIEKLWL